MMNSKGFSLLEIIISITILSFISLAITNFTDTSIDSAIRITEEDNESLQIETALSRLEWDISQAYSPLYFDHLMNPEEMTPEEGQIYNQLVNYYQNNSRFNQLSFNGYPIPLIQTPEKSSLVFFTSSNRRKIQNTKQSNFAWVKYELIPDELSDEEKEKVGTPTQMLVRRFTADNIYSTDQLDWEEVKAQNLLHKVESLIFEFWDDKKEKWTDNTDTILYGRNLIRAIKVSIIYYNPLNEKQLAVRIFRPLFPFFKPENMYEYLRAKTTTTSGGINPSTPGSPQGPNQGAKDDQ